MSIQEITGGASPVPPLKKGKPVAEAREASTPSDKVSLSKEAQALYESGQAKRLEEIRDKLNNGFYNNPDITAKIVDGLLDDLKKDQA